MAGKGQIPRPASERIMDLVDKAENGCWTWKGRKTHNGYGLFSIEGGRGKQRSQVAHRAAWKIFVGEIADGLSVLHSCDNRACVNPSHLSLGSAADNTADMCRKWRTRSKLTPDQVAAIRADESGYRDIAAKYGLASHKSIYNIKRGLTFRHDAT